MSGGSSETQYDAMNVHVQFRRLSGDRTDGTEPVVPFLRHLRRSIVVAVLHKITNRAPEHAVRDERVTFPERPRDVLCKPVEVPTDGRV